MVTTVDRKADADISFHVGQYNGILLQHCQAILGRLGWPGGSGPRRIGLTSCLGGEGVSTVAAHLAATAASSNLGSVLLVDGNLDRPSVHETFGVARQPGLGELLDCADGWADCVQPTSIAALSVLPAGGTGPRTGHGPDLTSFGSLLEQLSSRFRWVLFDMPSAGCVAYTLQLAQRLDAVLLVVQSERVPSEVARRTLDELGGSGAKIAGAVLNQRPRHIPDWLYQKL